MTTGRKKDPLWRNFTEITAFKSSTSRADGKKLKVVRAQCKYCRKNMVGLIARMRAHLDKCSDYASRNSDASTSLTRSRITDCDNDSSDDGQIVYEYVLEPESPSSSNKSAVRNEDVKPDISRNSRSLPEEYRSSDYQATPGRQQTQKVKVKEKNIIEELTKQKMSVAAMQMEVLGKEKQERTIKILMLKEEREHRKQMRELEKQEIMLRIESLKANLDKPIPGAVIPCKIDSPQ